MTFAAKVACFFVVKDDSWMSSGVVRERRKYDKRSQRMLTFDEVHFERT